MIAYWDANAFVLLYLCLPGQSRAKAMFATAELNLISKFTVFEAYRTISAMAESRHVSGAEKWHAVESLRRDQPRLSARSVDDLLQGAPLDKFLTLLDRHSKLGTADVLHLTTATLWRTELRKEITVVTRDRALAAAAKKERLKAVAPV